MNARQEFASKRDADLLSAEARLRPAVERALRRYGKREGWFAPIMTVVQRLWREFYADEQSERPIKSVRQEFDAFTKGIRDSLEKTTTPTAQSSATITRWLATSIVNSATLTANTGSGNDLEWVTMHDNNVRDTHREVDGERRRPGQTFRVGDSDLHYPGEPIGDPAVWINCRCVLRPVAERDSMTASVDEKKNKSAVVVALPHPDDPIHGVGTEQKHATLLFLGDAADVDPTAAAQAVQHVASNMLPAADNVSGRAELGPDKAQVVLLDGAHLTAMRDALLDQQPLRDAHDKAPQFPNFIPHVTVGYPSQPTADDPDGDGDVDSPGGNDTDGDQGFATDPALTPDTNDADPDGDGDQPEDESDDSQQGTPKSIHFNRLALWHGDDQTEFPLGGESMTASVTEEAPSIPAQPATIPWHGVLAPEGVFSGDKRRFAPGSLRNRDLPLPLTWQRVGDDGHKGHVVVAKMDRLWRDEATGVIRAEGTFLQNPEADQVIGQIAEFGRFGVSVDVDDATFDLDEGEQSVTFSDARICSACIVAIPAFAEAFVALGPWDGGESSATPAADDSPSQDSPNSLANDADEFGRGPGWVTNPKATSRIHDYWTVPGQPGYEKIGWGKGGDFNRCRVEIGEEIGESSPEKLRFINAQCAQWHHDALGYWPSTHKKMLGASAGEAAAPALSLVASSSPRWTPPGEWFANPKLDGPVNTPRVIEHAEGKQVFGHIAWWSSCHTGFPGMCVAPPRSQTDYSFFLTHSRDTTMGEMAVGVLSFGGGHADRRLGMRPAMAHYDDVATAVAEVNVGEDEHGIWYSGWVLPNVSDDILGQFQARPLSGDWRECAQTSGLELIAACSVNNPGFVKPSVHFSDGKQLSLVAAGVPSGEVFAPVGVSDVAREVRMMLAREDRMAEIRKEWRAKRLAELAAGLDA